LLDFIDVRSFFGQNKSYKFLNKYERFKLTLKAENEIDVLKNSIYCFLPSEVKKLLNNFEKNIETCFDDIRFLNQNNDSLDKIMAIDYKTYAPRPVWFLHLLPNFVVLPVRFPDHE
jgi:asparagine synthase (glutamine-hydrolysing)